MTLASIVTASIVPFDPTIAIAGVASIFLALFVAFVTFLALAPVISETWTEQLHATPNDGPTLEADVGDAD
ncbi:hypothetical protein D8Y22_01220 [Salinadaptatus halalkaliphilus]|uniref:Uncharacterized protein n=1 Tax=Salinadaptatus halalkaliphilus TaxID=2419781 RepID=A0A4S3TQT1_9EURY|nr:hypothetical protein [Salinadaptatus halalkaliphilus]THE66769.1 hypothetical protein D8Y22_01220 [Salinadaptatus halalkaliphilus]